MIRLIVILAMLTFSLTACLNMDPIPTPNLFAVTPSRPPAILTRTPILIYPTTTVTETLTTIPPSTSEEPTSTTTETATLPAPETLTPTTVATELPKIFSIEMLGCEPGIDLTHGMGNVTNVYINLVNASELDLITVCATLSATDEGRAHPDKMACVSSLPHGFFIPIKLTIDITLQANTLVDIAVTSNEELIASADGMACQDIGSSRPASETIGILQPIP